MVKSQKILILTWELYPVYAGGLGMLVKSVHEELEKQGHKVEIWMPYIPEKMKLDDAVSLEKLVKKYLRKDLTIKDLNFNLERFQNPNKIQHKAWPHIFKNPEVATSSSYNLYPNNTPSITKAFAWAVLENLGRSGQWDSIICMDWETLPSLFLLHQQKYKTPAYAYINSTEFDRSLGQGKLSDTEKKLIALEKDCLQFSRKIFAVSDFTKKILVQNYDVQPEKVSCILNDIQFIPSAESYGELKKYKTILFLGRFARQKGINFLLETATKLVGINPSIHFILAGDGELLPSTVDQIVDRRLEKNLWVTGWIDESHKRKLYNSVDLFVMPSPSEPFGLTAFEAIRSGVPVIASQNAGFTSVIESTPTFKYYDIESFTNIALKYLNDEQARAELLKQQKSELDKHKWSHQIQYFVKQLTKND